MGLECWSVILGRLVGGVSYIHSGYRIRYIVRYIKSDPLRGCGEYSK